jgi:hypothetical protein
LSSSFWTCKNFYKPKKSSIPSLGASIPLPNFKILTDFGLVKNFYTQKIFYPLTQLFLHPTSKSLHPENLLSPHTTLPSPDLKIFTIFGFVKIFIPQKHLSLHPSPDSLHPLTPHLNFI